MCVFFITSSIRAPDVTAKRRQGALVRGLSAVILLELICQMKSEGNRSHADDYDVTVKSQCADAGGELIDRCCSKSRAAILTNIF